MRIISRFRDFYDGVMRVGMDPNVVYVRESKEVLIKDDFEVVGSTGLSRTTYQLRYLGFCGKIYRIFTIVSEHGEIEHYYDLEKFKTAALNLGFLKEYDFKPNRWWPSYITRFVDEDTKPMLEFFHKYQVPTFIVEACGERNKHILILNPRLEKYRFQAIKDPYSTYQDIYQFVSGTLNGPEREMVKISDLDKIAKHGFDKWSFRQKGPKK